MQIIIVIQNSEFQVSLPLATKIVTKTATTMPIIKSTDRIVQAIITRFVKQGNFSSL